MEMRAPRGGGGRLLSPAASFIFDGPGFRETAWPNMVKRGALCTRGRPLCAPLCAPATVISQAVDCINGRVRWRSAAAIDRGAPYRDD
ncbi:hypothetical protein MRX96_024997 [Rhipicephalus microplus]